jgi:hypothetical protein
MGIGGSIGGTGGSFARGDGSTTAAAVQCDGYIDLDGSGYPTATTALKDKLTPWHFPKVSALVQSDGLGAVSLGAGGFNRSSVSLPGGGNYIRLTFAQAMANTDYHIAATCTDAIGPPTTFTKATTHVDIAYSSDPAGAARSSYIQIYGQQ